MKKKIALIKLSSVLLYLKNNNKFIFDLKHQNIAFDDKQNIILIDFSENLINNYKENSKYRINHRLDFGPYRPAYLRKIFYNFIKDNLRDIKIEVDNLKEIIDECNSNLNKLSIILQNIILTP